MSPLVGEDFNTTRAGIHADGLAKDEEIYNIFDTTALLKRPVRVLVNQSSGAAGVSHWINTYFGLPESKRIDKRDNRLTPLIDWVAQAYEEGRETAFNDHEMTLALQTICPDVYAEVVE